MVLQLTIIRYYPFFVADKHIFCTPSGRRCDASASASSLRVDARGLPYRRCESSPRRRRRRHRRRIARRRLGDAPAVACERDEQRSTSLLTVGRWGEEEKNELFDALREAVRQHDDVAYCDLDLHSLDSDELDEAVELLRNYDFFYCGLTVAGRAGHDHLRMQAMLTDNVDLEHIVLDSDYAKGLREAIFADRGWLESTAAQPGEER